MKIAIASNDGEIVGQHFGRAKQFIVVTVTDDAVAAIEVRPGPGTSGGCSDGAHRDGDCFDTAAGISDCAAIVVGGMGMGAFEKFREAGIEPVLTDAGRVDEAALRYARGDLPSLPDRLHRVGHLG